MATLADAADAAGALRPTGGGGAISADLATGLAAAAAEVSLEAPSERVALVIVGWTSLIGVVSAEVFGQLGPDGLGAPAAFADFSFRALADLVGL